MCITKWQFRPHDGVLCRFVKCRFWPEPGGLTCTANEVRTLGGGGGGGGGGVGGEGTKRLSDLRVI